MRYKVKVRFPDGESITFISVNLGDNNPFPDLEINEYLYFDWALHSSLLRELYNTGGYEFDWLRKAFDTLDPPICFLVYPLRLSDPSYVGLSREDASALAMNNNVSFRVVMENGIEQAHAYDVSTSRVNVYLNENIVYKAEIF